jgi:hypothetical protein
MADSRTPTRAVLPFVRSLLTTGADAACGQTRVACRLMELTLGLVVAFGRHTVTRVLVTVGQADADWSAAYRLFREARIDIESLRCQLLRRLVPGGVTGRPLTVVLDSTQLPRSSARLVGVGWFKAPRSPAWKPGIHRAQRWVGLSVLLPRSGRGESRAVPLWFLPAPSAKAKVWPGHPPCPEWEAGLRALQWLRTALTALGQARRPVLAVADGSYSCAPLWRALPPQVTLLARCAKNRALFALPTPPAGPRRGRRRLYGARGPTPQAQLQVSRKRSRRAWSPIPVRVRGREIPLRVRVTGPWLVKPAATQPLYLLVVAGIEKQHQGRRVQRDPSFWLVSARQDRAGAWVLPYPAADLLAWAWQRWEVEVMHRELKSGLGLGQQQAWHPVAAVTTTQWVVWTYAMLMLAGYHAWGWSASPTATRWYRGRRWTVRDVLTAVRSELWRGPLAFRDDHAGIGGNPGGNPPPTTPLAAAIRAAPHL